MDCFKFGFVFFVSGPGSHQDRRGNTVSNFDAMRRGNHPFSPRTVVIVTPVGKREHARLKSFGMLIEENAL
jgi:hypothetical protein